MKHILIIEDDAVAAALMGEYLKEKNYRFAVAESGYDALEKIQEDKPDLIFLDLGLPDMEGLTLLKKIRQASPDTEIHVLTGNESTEQAIRCIREGAKNYLLKPIEPDLLYVCIENAFERIDLNRQLTQLKKAQNPDGAFHDVIGRSNSMLNLYKTIENVADLKETILISGEKGTGKTLIAKTIHNAGETSGAPFIKCNCIAIDKDDAKQALIEHLKDAEGGTLYINNVDNLHPDAQVSLFALLEENVNTRVISSSSMQPLDAVKIGSLREDLYYRLNIIPIDIPPLRRRAQDINLLARFFLDKHSRESNKNYQDFDEATLRIFQDYHWPGNVLELENMVKTIVLLQPDGEVIKASMLPAHMATIGDIEDELSTPLSMTQKQDIFGDTVIAIRDLEKMAIQHALDLCGGNVQEAALKLKISPATLYRKKPVD